MYVSRMYRMRLIPLKKIVQNNVHTGTYVRALKIEKIKRKLYFQKQCFDIMILFFTTL